MSAEMREKTRRWSAWAGTRQDLRHVVEVVEAQIAPVIASKRQEELGLYEARHKEESRAVRRLEREISEAPESEELLRIQLERSLSRAQESKTHYGDLAKNAKRRFESSWRLQIETTDRNGDEDKQSGNSGDIIRRIDPKLTKKFAVRVPANSYMESHSIEFAEDHLGRLLLRVSSSDPQWTLAAVHEVAAEIDKHKLAWGWLRRFDVVLPASLFASVFLWHMFFSNYASSTVVAFSAASTTGLFCTALLWLIIRWTVPATQILADGKKPRAIALGLVAVGIAFQVGLALVGIFAPGYLDPK